MEGSEDNSSEGELVFYGPELNPNPQELPVGPPEPPEEGELTQSPAPAAPQEVEDKPLVITPSKSALLAKKRLQAYSKQLSIRQDVQAKQQEKKTVRKELVYPEDKAKTVIQEVEVVKPVENPVENVEFTKEKVVTGGFRKKAPFSRNYRKNSRATPPQERRSYNRPGEPKKPYRSSSDRRPSSSKSSRKPSLNYPRNWLEYKKYSWNEYKELESRKQQNKSNNKSFLHEMIGWEGVGNHPITFFTMISTDGTPLHVPFGFLRSTQSKPPVVFSENCTNLKESFLKRNQLFNFISPARKEIVEKLWATSSPKNHYEPKIGKPRSWFPKTWSFREDHLSEGTVSLSFLQTYSDDNRDSSSPAKKQENELINGFVKDPSESKKKRKKSQSDLEESSKKHSKKPRKTEKKTKKIIKPVLSSKGKRDKAQQKGNKKRKASPLEQVKIKQEKLDEGIVEKMQIKEEPDGSPDTDEYHSHWESDDGIVGPTITASKTNTSWESDEETFERPSIRSSRNFSDTINLEMPLTIKPFKSRILDKESEERFLEKEKQDLRKELKKLEQQKERIRQLEMQNIEELEEELKKNQQLVFGNSSFDLSIVKIEKEDKFCLGNGVKMELEATPLLNLGTPSSSLALPLVDKVSTLLVEAPPLLVEAPPLAAALENEYEQFIKAVGVDEELSVSTPQQEDHAPEEPLVQPKPVPPVPSVETTEDLLTKIAAIPPPPPPPVPQSPSKPFVFNTMTLPKKSLLNSSLNLGDDSDGEAPLLRESAPPPEFYEEQKKKSQVVASGVKTEAEPPVASLAPPPVEPIVVAAPIVTPPDENLVAPPKKEASTRKRASPERKRSPRRRRPCSPKSSRRKRSITPPSRRRGSRRRSSSPVRRRSRFEPLSPERRKKSRHSSLKKPEPPPPVTPPVGYDPVPDSTISDELLLKQQAQSEEYDSPRYYGMGSPKRVPLDERINQVLGLGEEEPEKEEPVAPLAPPTDYFNHIPVHGTYNNNYAIHNYHVTQPPPSHYSYYNYSSNPPPSQTTATTKVLQVGNMLQIVPTENFEASSIPPVTPSGANGGETTPPKIVQVGNMLQIVPREITPDESMRMLLLGAGQHDKIESPIVEQTTPQPVEKASAEETMRLKSNARRAERELRRQERDRRRKEKDKRRKEKEKQKQLKLKQRTEMMIKKALQWEDKDSDEDAEEELDFTLIGGAYSKEAGKGILVKSGGVKNGLKCVQFADGVRPGEGTSTSGGEELASPPPLLQQKRKKKKKIKVKLIKKKGSRKGKVGGGAAAGSDDEENLPPPPPPPGSPPPHLFPPRVKAPIINNLQAAFLGGVVSQPPPQTQQPPVRYSPIFRPPVASSIQLVMPPPPTHHHHGPPAPHNPPFDSHHHHHHPEPPHHHHHGPAPTPPHHHEPHHHGHHHPEPPHHHPHEPHHHHGHH